LRFRLVTKLIFSFSALQQLAVEQPLHRAKSCFLREYKIKAANKPSLLYETKNLFHTICVSFEEQEGLFATSLLVL
jgi:hypothetical protein